MLLRLFASVVTTLFFIASYGQSHSAEHPTLTKYDFPNEKAALDYWLIHGQDPQIDRDTIRKAFSELSFDYKTISQWYFDTFNFGDPRSDVFSNVYLNVTSYEGDYISKLCEGLIHENCRLKTLDLGGIYLSWERDFFGSLKIQKKDLPLCWWGRVAEALSKNISLESLILKGNCYTADQWSSIINALNGKQNLKRINLSGSHLSEGKNSEQFVLGIVKIIETCGSLEDLFLDDLDIGENGMVQLVDAISNSSVTTLNLKNAIMTPSVGKDFIKLLEGDKTFERIDLGDLTWKKFDVFNYYSYGMLKRIGMAATGKVDNLRLDQYYSTRRYPFDFNAYDPEWEFTKDASAVGFVGACALISLFSISRESSNVLQLLDDNS